MKEKQPKNRDAVIEGIRRRTSISKKLERGQL